MKKEQIIKVVCITGGLITIGLLAHRLLKVDEKRELQRTEKPIEQALQKVMTKKKLVPKPEPVLVKEKVVVPKVKIVPLKPIADEFPLQLGSNGKNVERLQIYLLRNYGWAGIVTGTFDDKVLERVKRHLKVEKVDETLFNKLEMVEPIKP